MYGLHWNDVLAGRVFSQSTTPLGLAIPVYTGTALGGGALPIWNPPDSGVNVELIRVSCMRASGTGTLGAIGLMARQLTAIATGAIMTALDTSLAPFNGYLFGGAASKVRSSRTGTNTVSAGVAGDWARTLFASGVEADATASGVTSPTYTFEGSIIVPPGVLVYLAGTLAVATLMASTIVWKEVPIVR